VIEFQGDFEMDRPPEELWAYFTCPDVLAEAAPGVEEMSVNSPHDVEAVISVTVGSVSPTFDVDVTVLEAEFPTTLEMVATGSGNRNAFETNASMDLQETESGGTLAHWRAAAQVSGLLASLGQRALDGVTERLVSNFFEDIEEMAATGVAAESTLDGAPEADVDHEDLNESFVDGA
jgi:carbon monoxide dehydrogenase subunit G